MAHARVQLVHAFRKCQVFLDSLKETTARIVERVPQKIFQRTLRRESEDTKDGENGSALGQKGNVDRKRRRTPRRRT